MLNLEGKGKNIVVNLSRLVFSPGKLRQIHIFHPSNVITQGIISRDQGQNGCNFGVTTGLLGYPPVKVLFVLTGLTIYAVACRHSDP